MASSASIHVDLHSTRGLTESEAQAFAGHERRRRRAQGAFTLLLLGLVVWFFGAAAMTHLRPQDDDDDLFQVDRDQPRAHVLWQLGVQQASWHHIDNVASGAIGMPSEGSSDDDGSEPTDSLKGSLGLSGLGTGAS